MNILFLCTGNSCRSQIAEGWARALGNGQVIARSAGIEAHGQNPRAIAVMREVGIDITTQVSKVVTPEMLDQAEVIVTVCAHADEHCPAVPAQVRKLHWPLSDPARAAGSEDEIMHTFRATREDIRRRVEALLTELSKRTNGQD